MGIKLQKRETRETKRVKNEKKIGLEIEKVAPSNITHTEMTDLERQEYDHKVREMGYNLSIQKLTSSLADKPAVQHSITEALKMLDPEQPITLKIKPTPDNDKSVSYSIIELQSLGINEARAHLKEVNRLLAEIANINPLKKDRDGCQGAASVFNSYGEMIGASFEAIYMFPPSVPLVLGVTLTSLTTMPVVAGLNEIRIRNKKSVNKKLEFLYQQENWSDLQGIVDKINSMETGFVWDSQKWSKVRQLRHHLQQIIKLKKNMELKAMNIGLQYFDETTGENNLEKQVEGLQFLENSLNRPLS